MFSKHLSNIENHPYIFVLLLVSIKLFIEQRVVFRFYYTTYITGNHTCTILGICNSATLIQAISSVYWCIYPRTIIMLSFMILLVQNRTSSQLLLLLTYKKTCQSFLHFYFIIMFKMRQLVQ